MTQMQTCMISFYSSSHHFQQQTSPVCHASRELISTRDTEKGLAHAEYVYGGMLQACIPDCNPLSSLLSEQHPICTERLLWGTVCCLHYWHMHAQLGSCRKVRHDLQQHLQTLFE